MENNENEFGRLEPELPRFSPAAPAEPTGKRKGGAFRAVLSLVLVLALVAGGCGLTYGVINSRWEQKAQTDAAAIEQMQRKLDTLQATPTENLSYVPLEEGAMTPKLIYQNYASSVVGISSVIQQTTYGGQTRQGTSTGSGFILTDDGYVVTNYHVIEGAVSVTVVMDTQEYDAEVVGYDSLNDVAVLKIDGKDLPAVKLGSSDELSIGDMVVAIGNPLGSLTATLTVGYVSGKDRQVSTDSANTVINMIQTDAAINSGNSGGPLFNLYGEVVGITSAKYSGTTSSGASIEGIGFAIPIDDVMSIIGDLRDFGYVTGAYLGITVIDTDASAAALYGMPTGAYVSTVEVEDGSAARAGVQPKDIIIALGENEVSNVTELTRALRRFKANDTTTITVIRAGERITMDITLDERPQNLSTTQPADPQSSAPSNGDYDEWFKYFFGEGGK